MSDVIPFIQKTSGKTSRPRRLPRPGHADFRRAHGVHELFDLQAERAPNAPAVIFNNGSLTYGELQREANLVAHELWAHGLGPESLVGLCSERSPEMLIGMIGALKAGLAYVPLEPAYPDERLNNLLADARPRALLAQPHLAPRFSGQSLSIIPLSRKPEAACQWSEDDAARASGAELAYVIYTSGSTGKPKGVLITHRSLVNHNLAIADLYQLRPEDRVLQFAAFSFDVAAEEIYPTLISGAAVVLWPVLAGTAPIRGFLEFVDEHRVTVLNLPAAYWHQWVAEMDRHALPDSVRLVIVGSDKVSARKFSVWQKFAGGKVRLLNAYGPTESTITATVFEPGSEWQPGPAECLPIGKPIANVQTYILDENRRAVPAGEPGELYLGGAGLARGYLNQPELTREKFIPDPFHDGQRLYRTGDLARLMPDGNLEFLGRVDDQVKVRGFRIETGEIEATMREFPNARDAVVVARDDHGGEKKLVGYLEIASAHRPTLEELKKFLKARLPEYMVPADFVMLRQFPLTPSGKIDRRNLPPPDFTRDDPAREYVAPRSDLERQLVEIWEGMLEIRPIGIRDNFFDLGGHSLMEVRLAAEIEKRLGLTLPLTSLYYTRTIERLAEVLERKGAAAPLVVAYRTKGTKPPIFSHGGSTHLADYLGEDQPIYWLQVYGGDGSRVPTTIQEAASHYLAEIRRIQPHGPYHLMGYCLGALMIYEIAQQLVGAREEIGLLALISPALPSFREHACDASTADAPAPMVTAPARIGFRRRLRGLAGRVRRRVLWEKRRSKRLLCELWLRSGKPLPLALRDFYLIETGDELIKRYVPEPYSGPVILFRSLQDGNEAQWRSVMPKVEIHNSWVDHNDFLEQPYVKTLVHELADFCARTGTLSSRAAFRPAAARPARSCVQPLSFP